MDAVSVCIETPKGSGQKYDYDPASGEIKLKKIMPLGLVFPFDFGFIPGTVGGDGDPLDVIVISEVSTFPGCVVDCRIVGALKVLQLECNGGKKVRNDRLIAIATVSRRYAEVTALRDLPKTILEQVVAFFTSYNEQAGKKFTVLERLGVSKAFELIEKGRKDLQMKMLVELFLPVYDVKGDVFPKKLFDRVRTELITRFGGVTEYSRSPVKGFWNNGESSVEQDNLLVLEIMCVEVDIVFWDNLKARLLKSFKQDAILIRYSKIELC